MHGKVATEMSEPVKYVKDGISETDGMPRQGWSSDINFEISVEINSVDDIVTARQEGRSLAKSLGFSSTEATLIATAISELARNILLYARTGEIVLSKVINGQRIGIIIIGKDEGPGILNLVHAMMSGYSTSGGLGLGLPGVKKIMDSFDIVSEHGLGTTVTTIMWL